MYFSLAYLISCICSEHLLAAWTSNSQKGLFPQPPVYALLTDLTNFIIFKYDGHTFSRQGMTIPTTFPDGRRYRYEFLSHMMPVAERLFSLILHGFIEYLNAVADKSKRRGEVGDDSSPPSSKQTVLLGEKKKL